MSLHRMKCRNLNCSFNGGMEAKSTQPIMKKIFQEKKTASDKAKGIAPVMEMMQVRCPKCGTRWRVRADQLH